MGTGGEGLGSAGYSYAIAVRDGDIFPDTDNDGVINAWDDCLNTPANSYVDNTGCAVDLSAIYDDGYNAGLLECAPPPPEEVVICHVNKNGKTMTKTISSDHLDKHISHGDYERAWL